MVALIFLGLLCSFGLLPSLVVAQTAADIAYTPQFSVCPSGVPLVRLAGTTQQSLSNSESAYISAKKSQVLPSAWQTYLLNVQNSAQANNIQLPSYVSAILADLNPQITLGIATSGGGYRAAIFGAGVLNAIDGRNTTSAQTGAGGLLQAATYLSGLSGGSWLVGSLIQNDFPPLLELMFGPNPDSGGWNAQVDLIAPSSSIVIDAEYIADLIGEIEGKFSAGFPVTITDVWARTLSRHFISGTTPLNILDPALLHGAGVTWSSISQLCVSLSSSLGRR